MSTEPYIPADQRVGIYSPAQPGVQGYPFTITQAAAAPVLELYQVPVPGAVQVVLPNGATAWAKHVEPRLEPVAVAVASTPREPMPAWAKAVCAVTGSLTALALGGALALRIAAPALGGLVELLDMIWKAALALAVIFFGGRFVLRSLMAADEDGGSRPGRSTEQPIVFAPEINTGGTRLMGRSGDVNIQWGDANRNKQ